MSPLAKYLSLWHFDDCEGVITRAGIQDACGKPAVAVMESREASLAYSYWGACAYHANRYGAGDADRVLPLHRVVAASAAAGSREGAEVAK